MDHGAVAGQHRRLDDVVVPIHRQRLGFLVDQNFQKRVQVLGVKARGGGCELARVAVPDNLDAASLNKFTWLGASTLPPRSTARSTITEPGRIEATISREIRRGAGRPGISAVVTTMSCFLICSATSAACFA